MSLIDREALIAEYDRVHVGAPGGARKLMVDAPEARPEQRWIPMKERRPEKDGRYLCTFQGKAVHICMYLNGCFRIYGYNEDNLITAWMPLPEPYREEEQDD